MTQRSWYRASNNFGRKLEWGACEVCGADGTILRPTPADHKVKACHKCRELLEREARAT